MVETTESLTANSACGVLVALGWNVTKPNKRNNYCCQGAWFRVGVKMSSKHYNLIWEDGQHSQRPLKAGTNYESSGNTLKHQVPSVRANLNWVCVWNYFSFYAFFFHSLLVCGHFVVVFFWKKNKKMYFHWKDHRSAPVFTELCVRDTGQHGQHRRTEEGYDLHHRRHPTLVPVCLPRLTSELPQRMLWIISSVCSSDWD